MTQHESQGGALAGHCPWYVERAEDGLVLGSVLRGESCYVLTSHQMGKTSLIVRLLHTLREGNRRAIALDLAAVGRDFDPDRWFDAVALQLGRKLALEDEFDAFLEQHRHLDGGERFAAAYEQIAAPRLTGPLVVFIDEIDILRSLAFNTDPFLAALARLASGGNSPGNRMTHCLFATVPPSGLVRLPGASPFDPRTIIPLNDFRPWELMSIIEGLSRCVVEHSKAGSDLGLDLVAAVLAQFFRRVYHWTNGHPYLTQKLASWSLHEWIEGERPADAEDPDLAARRVDDIAALLFLRKSVQHQDCNLAVVRNQMLDRGAEATSASALLDRITSGEVVRPDRADSTLERLLRIGVLRVESGCVRWRNRIYERVFASEWWAGRRPQAAVRTPTAHLVQCSGLGSDFGSGRISLAAV